MSQERRAFGFKLPGVGMYGSDVDVVTLEAYLELHQRYLFVLEACSKWAARVHKLETDARHRETM